MKKLIALIMAALLALSAVAFAETYHTGDVVFDYDEKVFDISLDDSTDDVKRTMNTVHPLTVAPSTYQTSSVGRFRQNPDR